MLTLWSRVAQIRGSCRCPQCLSVARNTTTSAARRPQYWTSSTLWYSGIFAAAASWDAANKVQRREKWDQAIAEIKEELGEYEGLEEVLNRQAMKEIKERKGKAKYGYTLHELAGGGGGGSSRRGMEHAGFEAQERKRMGSLNATVRDAGLRDMAAVVNNDAKVQEHNHTLSPSEPCVPMAVQDERPQENEPDNPSNVAVFEGDEALQELAANVDSGIHRKRKPRWPINTALDTDPKHLPPQSIYAPDYVKRKFEIQVWTAYKVERCMISTDLFLLHTWNELRRKGMSQEAADAVPSAYANYLMMSDQDLHKTIAQKEADLDRLERMGKKRFSLGWFTRSQGDVPLCRYHMDEYGEHHDTTRAMNQTIRDLLKQSKTGTQTIPALMAQICYNLSLSTSPPNIDTYNSLMVGLFDLRQVKHTEHVIHSMLRTRARPNEVTLATVLNFHSATGDASNFRWWVQRMRGGFDGLMNASPHTRISSLSGNRLKHIDNGKNDGLGTIVQLPYPTPMVFGALIQGVLDFSGFEAALRICESMASEGWSLCITGLGIILRNCTERKDWTSGLTIWKQIQLLKSKSTRYVSSTWTSESIGLQTFVAMLQLCARCGQRNVFEDVMNQAIRAHPKALTEIVEYVQSEKPAQPLRLEPEGGGCTSLDVIAPARKPPVDDTALALEFMPKDYPPRVADDGEDVVPASGCPIYWRDHKECWQGTPYPRVFLEFHEAGT